MAFSFNRYVRGDERGFLPQEPAGFGGIPFSSGSPATYFPLSSHPNIDADRWVSPWPTSYGWNPSAGNFGAGTWVGTRQVAPVGVAPAATGQPLTAPPRPTVTGNQFQGRTEYGAYPFQQARIGIYAGAPTASAPGMPGLGELPDGSSPGIIPGAPGQGQATLPSNPRYGGVMSGQPRRVTASDLPGSLPYPTGPSIYGGRYARF